LAQYRKLTRPGVLAASLQPSGFPIRNTALVVPFGMTWVPCWTDKLLSAVTGLEKSTKCTKLLLQRGRVVMFRMGIWRIESNNVCMNVRWLLLTASSWRLLVRVLIGCYDFDTKRMMELARSECRVFEDAVGVVLISRRILYQALDPEVVYAIQALSDKFWSPVSATMWRAASRCRFFWLSAFQLVRISVCSFVDGLQFLLDIGITTCGDARCTRFVGYEDGICRRRLRRVPASRTVVTSLEVFDGSRFTTQEIIFNRSIAVKSIASSCSMNDMMLGFLPPEDARRKRLKKDPIPPLPTRIESQKDPEPTQDDALLHVDTRIARWMISHSSVCSSGIDLILRFPAFALTLLLLASTFALGEALNYNKSLNSQVRSAYHGSTGITISWNTYDELSNPTVHYGLNANQLDQIATGNVSVTYNTSLTYNNHVQISGLLPNMQYYYLPEHLLPDAVPEPFTFTTSRPLGDNTPLHVAVVIDMGAMGDEGKFCFLANKTLSSLWLPRRLHLTLSHILVISPMPTHAHSDHHSSAVYGQENFTGYVNHWRMPSDVATQAPNNLGVGNMWYSYDHGMVHFVSVDTETDIPNAPDADYPAGPFAPSGQQVAWLKADLAAVNRSVTPWVIVFGHRPYYTSGDSCAPCQAAFEDIFIEYNVDLVMNGHFHVFERNAPIGKNGAIDPNGLNNPAAPWYIINGLGGHYAGLDTFSQIQPYQDFGIDLNNATYGWSRLTFHNCSHLTHELVNSSSNAVIDTATLYKARSCPSAIINNYDIPGFEKPVSLSGAIQAPRSYMGYSHLDTFNPSQCAAICNSKKASNGNYACDFFTVYAEQIDGVSEGAFCAFYSSTWNTTYATNHGQYRGGKHVTIGDAYSYSRST
ncbi:hypothetical protein KCV07_g542, partial [Aureobasidium melanogenum]